MTSTLIRSAIVAEKTAWIRKMAAAIRELPLAGYDVFIVDPRNAAAAESYLRRALEALLDFGRHILARGFAIAATEYKEIGVHLREQGVLSAEDAGRLRLLAGYRNRMVHFYQEISTQELYEICRHHVADVERLCDTLLLWLKEHPEKLDRQP